MLRRAYDAERGLFDEISYWAPAEARQVEVDFLLQGGAEALAIAVQAGERFAASQLAGLRAVSGLPGLVRRILLYNGSRELQTADDGIEVWPLRRFLAALAENTL